MRRRLKFTILILVAGLISLQSVDLSAAGGGGGRSSGCGGGCNEGPTTIPLSEYEKQALNIAINEEYKARAIYRKVIDKFGPIDPFSWIVRDEQMHVNWLANLHTKYGLPIPQDQWSGNIIQEFSSKQQACEIGAQAEADNAAAYDTMLPGITHDDIISNFH